MSTLFKSTIIVMGFSAISKVSGFFRETTVASAYGVSEAMDAFLVAALLPQFMSVLMQSGITKAFVSIYHEISSIQGKQQTA